MCRMITEVFFQTDMTLVSSGKHVSCEQCTQTDTSVHVDYL